MTNLTHRLPSGYRANNLARRLTPPVTERLTTYRVGNRFASRQAFYMARFQGDLTALPGIAWRALGAIFYGTIAALAVVFIAFYLAGVFDR